MEVRAIGRERIEAPLVGDRDSIPGRRPREAVHMTRPEARVFGHQDLVRVTGLSVHDPNAVAGIAVTVGKRDPGPVWRERRVPDDAVLGYMRLPEHLGWATVSIDGEEGAVVAGAPFFP